MEGIGAELDARADFSDLRGLLQHLNLVALAHQGQGRGQSADAATADDDRLRACRCIHGFLLRPSISSVY